MASDDEGGDAMKPEATAAVSVVKAGEAVWTPAWSGPEEQEAPGRESTTFEAGPFSTGLWQRDEQNRLFERPYHEVAFIIEGEVEVTCEDGQVVKAGPGDILVTPKGSKGYWRNLAPVTKFWAIFEDGA
jgi:uncharacterized cupin superfamily protein